MSGRAPKKSDNTQHLEVLRVPNTSSRYPKRASRQAAIKNCPDKGGDQKKFKERARANEVLSDPFFGESLFGGFGGGSSRGGRQMRGLDVVHPLKVSLDDLYNGITKKLSISRNILCSKCKGKGSKSRASTKCKGCKGRGEKVSARQLLLRADPCNECNGTGEIIADKDRCPQCKGDKVLQEKKILEVIVEKGMQNCQKITFPKASDEAPNTVPGDIVFLLQQKVHPKFKRKGDDLYYEHTLSSTETLCNFQFSLTHLDNRQLLIKSEPGEIIKPDEFKGINDEGMPMYQRPYMKGKLYIHFTVDSPNCAKKRKMAALDYDLYKEDIPLKAPKVIEMRLGPGHFNQHVKFGVPVYIPFEFATGYALFRAHGFDDEVGENFESTEEYIKLYKQVFTLVAAYPFASASDALFQMNAVSRDIVTDQMRSLLVNNLGEPDPKDNKYYIASLAFAGALATKMPHLCDHKTISVMRGLRLNICEFINDLQPAELEKAQRELALSCSKQRLKGGKNSWQRLKQTQEGNSVATISSSPSFNEDVLVVSHRVEGVFKAIRDEKEDVICTKNLVPGEVVYGEELISIKDANGVEIEYRVWSPLKSKLAASILSGVHNIWVKPGSRVLCMGDVSGATVSHLSDLVGPNGLVYAVAMSVAVLQMAEKRSNVVPIYEDVLKVSRYRMLLSMVDVICFDQYRPEAASHGGLLHVTCEHYLKTGGHYLVITQVDDVVSNSHGEPMIRSYYRDAPQHKILELVKLKLKQEEEKEVIFFGRKEKAVIFLGRKEKEVMFMAVGEYRTQLNGVGGGQRPRNFIEGIQRERQWAIEDQRAATAAQRFLNQDYHA